MTSPSLTQDLPGEGMRTRRHGCGSSSLLHERTGGNPFFVRQLARLLLDAEDGAVDPTTAPVPAGVLHVIASRLKPLRASTRDLLAARAVIRRDFYLRLAATPPRSGSRTLSTPSTRRQGTDSWSRSAGPPYPEVRARPRAGGGAVPAVQHTAARMHAEVAAQLRDRHGLHPALWQSTSGRTRHRRSHAVPAQLSAARLAARCITSGPRSTCDVPSSCAEREAGRPADRADGPAEPVPVDHRAGAGETARSDVVDRRWRSLEAGPYSTRRAALVVAVLLPAVPGHPSYVYVVRQPLLHHRRDVAAELTRGPSPP